MVVTGGAGFIGRNLVRRLLSHLDQDIVVLDLEAERLSAEFSRTVASGRLRLISGDVRDPSAVGSAMAGADAVYHLAARHPKCAEHEAIDDTFETNVTGTLRVLWEAQRQHTRRVVFTSSYEVYGEPVDLPVGEAHPLLALNCFGASKAAAEMYCRAFRREFGLETAILRLADVFGRGDRSGHIAGWIKQAFGGGNLAVVGDHTSDFISVDVVIDALIRVGGMEQAPPPINIGSGTGVKHADLARRIVASAGAHGHVRILPAHDLKPSRFVASVDRMRDLLGIEPPLDPLAQVESLITRAGVPLGQPLGHLPTLIPVTQGVN